ncbi:hypothetical protein PybrP1_008335 [[Pythium] brassicae (nom. inval.)]|nr:hypothetical protein PybrP1_008335 [[Pythium] brassicae (nom. inval.)]
MDASTQVAPMPVLHSVMMLKVSEASRATSVTRAAAAAAAAAATTRRNSLSLQHALLQVSAAESAAASAAAAAAAAAAVPTTPLASDLSAIAPAAPKPTTAMTTSPVATACSPRDPSSKVTSSPQLFPAKLPVYAVSPLKLYPPIQTHAAPLSPGSSSSSSESAPSSPEASPVGKRHQSMSGTPKSSAASPSASSPKSCSKANTGRSSSGSALSTAASSHHLVDASEYSDASVSTPRAGSPGKKKSMLRKRKFTMDEDSPALSISAAAANGDASALAALPSLPKRMMKEKKFPREKHMSPKQKAPVSGNKFFGASFSSPESSGSESAHRAVFSRGGAGKIPPHPLDFEDEAASEGMILDFADDKSIVEYPFHLDGSMDQSISSMDNDDLLQLTDDECLDWFSAASGEQEELLKSEPVDVVAAGAASTAAAASSEAVVALDTMDSSPLTLGRYHFSPLYTDECLEFSDATVESASSSASVVDEVAAVILDDAETFVLGGDEDDDFVLDPEKFLSSYFSPASEN